MDRRTVKTCLTLGLQKHVVLVGHVLCATTVSYGDLPEWHECSKQRLEQTSKDRDGAQG